MSTVKTQTVSFISQIPDNDEMSLQYIHFLGQCLMHSRRLFTTPKFLPTTIVWKEESTQNGELATLDSTSRCCIY